MKVAFVDTLYFVALFNPRDQWHERAIAASKLVAETKLITTEDVLQVASKEVGFDVFSAKQGSF